MSATSDGEHITLLVQERNNLRIRVQQLERMVENVREQARLVLADRDPNGPPVRTVQEMWAEQLLKTMLPDPPAGPPTPEGRERWLS